MSHDSLKNVCMQCIKSCEQCIDQCQKLIPLCAPVSEETKCAKQLAMAVAAEIKLLKTVMHVLRNARSTYRSVRIRKPKLRLSIALNHARVHRLCTTNDR